MPSSWNSSAWSSRRRSCMDISASNPSKVSEAQRKLRERQGQVRTRSLAFVLAAVLVAPLSLAAQSSTTSPAGRPAAKWTPPRTPDGRPDLQGMWTNATYTPLQRPANLGTKAFYTDEELA